MPDPVADDRPTAGRLDADLLLASGRWHEALDLYDSLLATGTDDPRQRAELLRGRAEALCRLYRGGDAMGSAAQAALLFDALGSPADAAWARYWLSGAHLLQDDPSESRAILVQLLAADRAGLEVAPDFRFRILVQLGNTEAWDGQPERALTYMEEARSLVGGMSLSQQAAFLGGLALQYRHVGDLEGSIRVGEECVAFYREAGAEQEQAAMQTNLALNFIDIGNTTRAEALLREARVLADRHGDRLGLSNLAEAEARLALAQGDWAGAIERAEAALAAAADGGSYLAAVGAHRTLARLAIRGTDWTEAEARFEAAAALLREHRARSLLRDLLAEWADMRSGAGDPKGASALYAEALGRGTRASSA
jgi:tetratricopeptide (TPR) repeat protein